MQRKYWSRLLIFAMILLSAVGATTGLLKFIAANTKTDAPRTAGMTLPRTDPSSDHSSAAVTMQFPSLPKTSVPSHSSPAKTPGARPTATGAVANVSTGSANWTLIYSDDFTGSQLSSTWGTYNGPHTGGQSYYSPQEVQVQNGLLRIAIERKTTNGLPYTSGGLAAFGLAQTYGKYEVRAMLPLGKGLDPYAILWPKTAAPNTAQVDIFESPSPTKSQVLFTNHGVDGSSSGLTASGSFAAAFHIFTCEWTPGQLRFLVDGVLQGTVTRSVFTQPMWFGLAISSGDALTGLPDSATVLPTSMQVDWVHIYKYNG
ncbi:MAG TPA: glycoside hydrolase family 16 protein [Ktedonobacteraceae bacterium]|nr:glycoside hydrolase family 16 protein [Ktedonobacteraceae bacterium]